MKTLVIDTEFTVGNWTKGQGGDPFDPRNKLCLVGCLEDSQPSIYKIEYDEEPYGDALGRLQGQITKSDLLVLFNAKRDLHWLRRYGIEFQDKRIWDVQLAHFILTGQENPYPSLNDVANHYDLGQKDEVIENEYLSKRIDIDEVPLDRLVPYLHQDLSLTQRAYEAQLLDLPEGSSQRRLVNLCCVDLLILEEMEWNGLVYDVEESLRLAEGVRTQIAGLDSGLYSLIGTGALNWNSGEHISVILYGGSIAHKSRVADGVYKTGKKAGHTKYRIETTTLSFPRLVIPLPRTELKKYGFYATSEPVLRQLKATGKARQIIESLLARATLEKLVSSYYEGIPEQIADHAWDRSTIHGTLNQCVAATGRLSSSKPNLQNNPDSINLMFRSRYD